MKRKPEVYFEPTDYNKEGWGFMTGDVKNEKKRLENQKKKERLAAKKNIKLKK